jgi:hypothetical protein
MVPMPAELRCARAREFRAWVVLSELRLQGRGAGNDILSDSALAIMR